MGEIWPFEFKNAEPFPSVDPLRPFRCLLLMPFRPQFGPVAELLRGWVREAAEDLFTRFGLHLPKVERLDWIKSSGAIQHQLWREIHSADLIFCDVTDYNPNVMFEAGVAAAWKAIHKVVFLRSKAFEPSQPFDIAPFRYIEYDLSDQGIPAFKNAVRLVTTDAIVPFPDEQISAPSIQTPLTLDFSEGHDDPRLYTPPYCHRRVIDGAFQFGSIFSYPHSWASIGNLRIQGLDLHFQARFGLTTSIGPQCKIGVAIRSQHFYANFGHIVVLASDGSIVVTQPDNEPPEFYSDIPVRGPTPIDPSQLHDFHIAFNDRVLTVRVDDFSRPFPVPEMTRVFGPGLVRFHATRSWMDITTITLAAA
jgi:hypothetical protein